MSKYLRTLNCIIYDARETELWRDRAVSGSAVAEVRTN